MSLRGPSLSLGPWQSNVLIHEIAAAKQRPRNDR